MPGESQAKRVSRKLAVLKAGGEPKVTTADLMACEPGEVPLPDERCVLQLARAIHRAESTDVATSWSAQERAMAYFNAHGLADSLDEMFRLEALALPDAD